MKNIKRWALTILALILSVNVAFCMVNSNSEIATLQKKLISLKKQLQEVENSNSYSKPLAIARLKAEIRDIEKRLLELKKKPMLMSRNSKQELTTELMEAERELEELYKKLAMVKASNSYSKKLAIARLEREIMDTKSRIRDIMVKLGVRIDEYAVGLNALRNIESTYIIKLRRVELDMNNEKILSIINKFSSAEADKVKNNIRVALKSENLEYIVNFINFVELNEKAKLYGDILSEINEGLNYLRLISSESYDKELHKKVQFLLSLAKSA